LGRQLKGKVLGIVGMGRIGSLVSKYALALDMEIIYFDPFVVNKEFKKCTSLNQLLSLSDIVSFHVHLDKSTINLINSENIKYIKTGSFLINTSRGEIFDEKSIYPHVKSGQISGIASDVLEGELSESLNNSFFRKLQDEGENVILTPHIGGATVEAMQSCEEYISSFFLSNSVSL